MKITQEALPVRQEKQLEDAMAEATMLRDKQEKQSLTMQYVAEMAGIFIPDEEENDEQDVHDFAGDEV